MLNHGIIVSTVYIALVQAFEDDFLQLCFSITAAFYFLFVHLFVCFTLAGSGAAAAILRALDSSLRFRV